MKKGAAYKAIFSYSSKSKPPSPLNQLEQRITHTDDKINEKVYALYGLSEEEVKLVEGVDKQNLFIN